MLRRFLALRWKPGTRQGYEDSLRRLERFAGDLNLDPTASATRALFVLHRVRQGVAADTVRKDLVGIRQLRPEWPEDPIVRHALSSAVRLADVPHAAKLPLSAEQMRMLRLTISRSEPSGVTGDARVALQTRDWTFFQLGFVGFFRGAELVSLRWPHVKFQWKVADDLQVETVGAEPPRAALAFARQRQRDPEPLSATFYLPESKTDAAGAGQLVCVKASTSPHLADCPVRRLAWMWHRRPRESDYVFVDVRRPEQRPLSTDTFRGRLRRYLSCFLPAERVHDYALHSLRRGGATAAARAGIPMRLIRRHGRWRSDVAYLYTLVSDEEALRLSGRLVQDLAE